jgi:hypothetical protein
MFPSVRLELKIQLYNSHRPYDIDWHLVFGFSVGFSPKTTIKERAVKLTLIYMDSIAAHYVGRED